MVQMPTPVYSSKTRRVVGGDLLCWPALAGQGVAKARRPCWSRTAADGGCSRGPGLRDAVTRPSAVHCPLQPGTIFQREGLLGVDMGAFTVIPIVAPKVEMGVHPSALSWAVYYAN